MTGMRKVLFVARALDNHSKQLLSGLSRLGFVVKVLGPPEVNPGEGVLTVNAFEQAAHSVDVIYLVLDSSENEFAPATWDLSAYTAKLVVDAARCSLNQFHSRLPIFLDKWRPMVVVRDRCQIMGPAGHELPLESLLCEDYLRYSYMSKVVLADLVWFLRKRIGDQTQPNPPSQKISLLLNQPHDDKQTESLARQLLDDDSEFTPAIMRCGLAELLTTTGVPKQLTPNNDSDPLQVFSLLAMEKWLPPASANAQLLARVKKHAWRSDQGDGIGKRILLFVVYKQRDLFVDLILRYHLERLGHEVIMRSLGEDPAASIVELLPDVVIWGAKTTPYQVQLAQFARDHNVISIVRREEGGTSRKRWDTLSRSVKNWTLGNVDYSPLVDLELVFCENFAEILRREGCLSPERCMAAGGMTFDPYHLPDFKRFLPDRNEYCRRMNLDAGKKNMLLLTPWTYADREQTTAIPEASGAAKDNSASEQIVKTMEIHRRGRIEWLNFLEKLYHDLGREWNLILKVHPGEKAQAYADFFQSKGLDIKLVLSGYVVEMLNYTDFVVHAGSTTGVETHLLNIPSLAYWVQSPDIHPIYTLVPYSNSYEEFKTNFNQVDLGRSNADAKTIKVLEREFYGVMDGESCRRGAEFIHEFIKDLEVKPFRYLNEQIRPQGQRSSDPYGTNITDEEVDYYYPRVKACLNAKYDNALKEPGCRCAQG